MQQASAANVKLLHPDYEYCFFDDEDVERFIDREYPQHRDIFDGFRFAIQRYDFFRYLAVHRLGGFYFDLDVFLAHNVSDLLTRECVFPFEGLTLSKLLRRHGMDWEIGNYAFGAVAGHAFLATVIANCVKAQRDPSWVKPMMHGVPPLSRAEYQVLYATGPGLVTRTFAENPELARTVSVLLPADICDTRSWHQFGSFGVHLMEGTWRPTQSYLRRRITQVVENRAMQRRLEEVRRRTARGVGVALSQTSADRTEDEISTRV